jgi:hypothetical protein
MIFDNNLLFSSNQAITASTASTNTIDLGATGTPYGFTNPLIRDIGRGDGSIELSVTVTQTFNNLTSLQVSVQTSNDLATWATVETKDPVLLVTLVAGHQFRVPSEFVEGLNQRYVRLYYTVNGTAPTTGAINAGVVASRQTNNSFGGQS